MANYFISSERHLHHLSVGAVVLNERGEVLCHHFPTVEVGEGEVAHDLYLLIRETPEPGESLEQAVERGLIEEAGATATIRTYLGSIASQFPRGKQQAEKTTLYFLCSLDQFDPSKRNVHDEEKDSEFQFIAIDELIEHMKRQASQFTRTDLNESNILKEAKRYL